MKRAIQSSLLGLMLLSAACGKSGDSSSGPAAGPGAPQPAQEITQQVGQGSINCPFEIESSKYLIKVPEQSQLLDSVGDGRYVLTAIRTQRSTLTMPDSWNFTNGSKIILKEPGKITPDDTTHVLIQDTKIALTGGNLSFPLDFSVAKKKVTWGSFMSYEPKIEIEKNLALAKPVASELGPSIMTENAGRYSFNVFARKKLSGYSTLVRVGRSDLSFIKGLILIAGDEVKFIVSLPRGSSSTEVLDTSYELVFKKEAAAKAPECGPNSSAIKIVASEGTKK